MIVDVGAGTGNYNIALARLGYQFIAVKDRFVGLANFGTKSSSITSMSFALIASTMRRTIALFSPDTVLLHACPFGLLG